jgi:hypothetical protein
LPSPCDPFPTGLLINLTSSHPSIHHFHSLCLIFPGFSLITLWLLSHSIELLFLLIELIVIGRNISSPHSIVLYLLTSTSLVCGLSL